jgi:hypothetical protein
VQGVRIVSANVVAGDDGGNSGLLIFLGTDDRADDVPLTQYLRQVLDFPGDREDQAHLEWRIDLQLTLSSEQNTRTADIFRYAVVPSRLADGAVTDR